VSEKRDQLDRLYAQLEQALLHAGGTHRLSDVIAKVQAGRAQWWGDERASVITELVRYPRACGVRYWLAAGELRGVLALEERINRWAAVEGADHAELLGRPGWRRWAPARGWREAGVILRKELEL
jgi:hypothetical protein